LVDQWGDLVCETFIIAVAQKYNACIITDEGNGSESDFKISYACKKLSIECIKFCEFLSGIVEGWRIVCIFLKG
jgi:hypothetical protein